MTITTNSVDLLARTIDMVNSAPRHIKYKDMAKAAEVSAAWITRFARNDIPDPGIRRVQKLHDYLVSVSSNG